jgi:hypothetical protein
MPGETTRASFSLSNKRKSVSEVGSNVLDNLNPVIEEEEDHHHPEIISEDSEDEYDDEPE